MKIKQLVSNKKGFLQVPLMIALVLMAVAIPVATSVVKQNQDNRNRAAGEVEGVTTLSQAISNYTTRPQIAEENPIPKTVNSYIGTTIVNGTSPAYTCKSRGGICLTVNQNRATLTNIATPCPTGYQGIGPFGSDCGATTQKCCIPIQKPTLTPVPVKTCSWCGTSCIKKKADTVCAAVMPPANQTCVTLNDGTCAIKGLGLIQPRITPAPVKPTITPIGSCDWCGYSCIKKRPGLLCSQIAPPTDLVCTSSATGACVVKSKIQGASMGASSSMGSFGGNSSSNSSSGYGTASGSSGQ
jgi:hypothetical protein